MTRALTTVLVSDALPEIPVSELADDLSEIAHVAALSLMIADGVDPSGCKYDWFAVGELDRGRSMFLGCMRALGLSDAEIDQRVGAWDKCQRPVAVVHVAAAR